MAEAEVTDELCSKRKAITTLLPYAILQERDGQPEILDTFLHAVRASRTLYFTWHHANQFAGPLFPEASPRAIVLASPYILRKAPGRDDLIQRWAAAASVVPYTEEVAQSVVEALLQIAFNCDLLSHATDIWSWLTKRPSLPPVSMGRSLGIHPNTINVVRELKDIEILKSYLLLVWSEWNRIWYKGSFDEMCASTREDFGGIGMGHHRADLIQRLDHILAQLDRGLEYLKQHNPDLNENSVQRMKDQYGELRGILLEMNLDTIARTSYTVVTLPQILTEVDVHRRISHDIYVCATSPMSVGSRLEPSTSLPHFICIQPTFIPRSSRHISGPNCGRPSGTFSCRVHVASWTLYFSQMICFERASPYAWYLVRWPRNRNR